MQKQSGNALFLILIAVALFAALSYAITQSGRGGGTISREKAQIAASQITEFGATVSTAVQRMIVSGAPETSICYSASSQYHDNCHGPTSTRVFHPDGGGIAYQCPEADHIVASFTAGDPPDANTGTAGWHFRGIHRTSDKGWYIKDVGTNTDVTGRDSFSYLAGVPLVVCEQINKSLGLAATPADDTAFGGYFGMEDSTYNEAHNVIYSNPGAPFACVLQTSSYGSFGSLYGYYHLISAH